MQTPRRTTFVESSPQTPDAWSMTPRGGMFDALGDQVGHYLTYHASPGFPCYRDTGYVLACVYERTAPGTGTGGLWNHRFSTWASVADAKAWMLRQQTTQRTLV
jgi:hypothetical protein